MPAAAPLRKITTDPRQRLPASAGVNRVSGNRATTERPSATMAVPDTTIAVDRSVAHASAANSTIPVGLPVRSHRPWAASTRSTRSGSSSSSVDQRDIGAARERPPQSPEALRHDEQRERGDEAGHRHAAAHHNVADHEREPPADRVGENAGRNLGDHHGDALERADEHELEWRQVGVDDEVERGDEPVAARQQRAGRTSSAETRSRNRKSVARRSRNVPSPAPEALTN